MPAKNANGQRELAESAGNHDRQGKRSNSPDESQPFLASIAAERGILGAIAENDDLVMPDVIGSGLRPADFFLSDHRRIFAAMLELWQEKKHVDLILVHDRLGNRPVDVGLVGSLIQGVIVHPDHVLDHVEIVRSKARLRNLLGIGVWITRNVDDQANPDALIEQAMGMLERAARPEVRA